MTPEQRQKLLEGAALKAPPGIQPQLENPPDMAQVYIILCIVCTVVTTAMVLVRFITRYFYKGKYILEDALIFAGWAIFVVGINHTVIKATQAHLGAHQWDLKLKFLITQLRLLHTGVILFFIIIILIRLAIILQILRAFVPSGARNITFWASHSLIWTNTLFWACLILLEIFSCSPIARLWDPTIPGKCIDRHAYLIASGAMNLISEILLLLLPQHVIWTLSMTRKQKMQLSPLFLFGILTCTCSAVRLYYTIALWPTEDYSYYIAESIILWAIPEIACSLVVPCLPSVPQFYKLCRRGVAHVREFNFTITMPTLAKHQPAPKEVKEPKQIDPQDDGDSMEPRNGQTQVSDMEYHELVMLRTDTTGHSTDHEERYQTGHWIRAPADAHLVPLKYPRR